MNMYYEEDPALHIRLMKRRVGPDSGSASKGKYEKWVSQN